MSKTSFSVPSGDFSKASDVFYVRPSDLVVNPADNIRFDLVTDEKVAQMEESLLIHGQLQEVLVFENLEKRLELYAGYTRTKAAKRIEEVDPNFKIRVRLVKNVNPATLFEQKVVENLLKNELTMLDRASIMRKFENQYGWDKDRIAKLFGVTVTVVYSTMKLLGADVELQEAVIEEAISPSAAIEATALPVVKQKVIARKAKAAKKEGKKLKTSEIKAEVRASGGRSPRGLTDLRKVLNTREDEVSKMLIAFIDGTIDDNDLERYLDSLMYPQIQDLPEFAAIQ